MGPVLRAARWPPSVDVKGELRFLPSLSSEPWPQPHPPFEGSLLRKSPLPMGFWVCGRVSVALDSKVHAPSPPPLPPSDGNVSDLPGFTKPPMNFHPRTDDTKFYIRCQGTQATCVPHTLTFLYGFLILAKSLK